MTAALDEAQVQTRATVCGDPVLRTTESAGWATRFTGKRDGVVRRVLAVDAKLISSEAGVRVQAAMENKGTAQPPRVALVAQVLGRKSGTSGLFGSKRLRSSIRRRV